MIKCYSLMIRISGFFFFLTLALQCSVDKKCSTQYQIPEIYKESLHVTRKDLRKPADQPLVKLVQEVAAAPPTPAIDA